ncbi:MAG: 4-(cytidine 5'-diphospho)-2-C-methyl-D-erythritol kinase [Pseudomonadota bacterium]|nr:4-(cytidine 5'-diphospho)-2-C-methyl-D-erythritol kinase [Pseudomonadota bacterium]
MLSDVTKLSPAKINLFLEVNGKRRDGYHNIESLMTFCNFGDLISVRRSDKFYLEIKGPFAKLLENKENLLETTIKKIEDYYKRKFEVKVQLTKNLPISSGMGGGSSNAATLIRCIKEIYNLKTQDSFNDLLLSIGADVPFCFYGKTALVQGIGEKIKFLDYDLKEYYILLVNPGIEISTNEIFQSLKITNSGSKKMSVISKKLDINYFQKRDNDLEKEVVKKYRIVGEILEKLSSYKKTLISRMTGSGSTCFALFSDLDDLKRIESQIKRKYKNVWVKASKLINSIEDI